MNVKVLEINGPYYPILWNNKFGKGYEKNIWAQAYCVLFSSEKSSMRLSTLSSVGEIKYIAYIFGNGFLLRLNFSILETPTSIISII